LSLVQSKGRRDGRRDLVVVVVVLDPTIRLLHTTWVVGMRTCWGVCVCVCVCVCPLYFGNLIHFAIQWALIPHIKHFFHDRVGRVLGGQFLRPLIRRTMLHIMHKRTCSNHQTFGPYTCNA
jgi:hypothetical protein